MRFVVAVCVEPALAGAAHAALTGIAVCISSKSLAG